MHYNELQSTGKKTAKRVGRGIAAGGGKTAGRGTKGQNARAGSSKRPGFEGGQNPLMQRLPKLRGFRSLAEKMETVYTGQLAVLNKSTVTPSVLAENGLISSPYVKVKLLVKGDLTKKMSVSLQAASASAIDAIQKAGGTFEQIAQQPRPASEAKQVKKSSKTQQ